MNKEPGRTIRVLTEEQTSKKISIVAKEKTDKWEIVCRYIEQYIGRYKKLLESNKGATEKYKIKKQ